ncbi:MAG: hypothetical protein HY951_14410 [Bacteroidia bacterium]|nr:hypothetical protein [Bacteroidia bacterium]
MDNNEKLSLFRNVNFRSKGLTDIPYNKNLKKIIVNPYIEDINNLNDFVVVMRAAEGNCCTCSGCCSVDNSRTAKMVEAASALGGYSSCPDPGPIVASQ